MLWGGGVDMLYWWSGLSGIMCLDKIPYVMILSLRKPYLLMVNSIPFYVP